MSLFPFKPNNGPNKLLYATTEYQLINNCCVSLNTERSNKKPLYNNLSNQHFQVKRLFDTPTFLFVKFKTFLLL